MKLRKSLINYATLTLFSALLLCASPAEAKAPKGFAEPIRLRAGDGFMKAERGYATPCLADIDGDGTKELLAVTATSIMRARREKCSEPRGTRPKRPKPR